MEIRDIAISTLRWLIGLTVGSLLGIAFGVLIYYFSILGRGVSVLFHFARAIPVLGLVPVIQFAFGISELGKIGLISWAVMFPVWLSVQTAIAQRYPELELILRSLNVARQEYFAKYVLPKIYAGILQGVQIGIGIGWLSVVAAEFIGTFSKGFWAGGLGYKLFLAFDLNDWRTGLVALGIFGVLGLMTANLWEKVICQRVIVRRGFDPLIGMTHR